MAATDKARGLTCVRPVSPSLRMGDSHEQGLVATATRCLVVEAGQPCSLDHPNKPVPLAVAYFDYAERRWPLCAEHAAEIASEGLTVHEIAAEQLSLLAG